MTRTVMDVKCLLLLLSAVVLITGRTQHTGKRFIASLFSVYPNGRDRDVPFVSIGHTHEGSCTLTNSDGNSTDIQLRGNSTFTQFSLPYIKELYLGIFVDNRAIELECTTDVSFYIFLRRHVNVGAFGYPVLPIESLSNRYIVASVPNNPIVGIAALFDNTTVTFHFKSDFKCTYYVHGTYVGRGSKLTRVLNKRDVFQIAGRILTQLEYCDLGGSIIESSAPVAVFSGSPGVYYQHYFSKTIMSQVPPVTTWGTQYIVPPPLTSDMLRSRILAAYNDTTVTIELPTGVKTINLHETEFYDQITKMGSEAVYIHSTKPILVRQIFGKAGGIVPPIEDYGTEYLIPDLNTDDKKYQRHVIIFTSADCTSNIDVDAPWTTQSNTSLRLAFVSFKDSYNFTSIRSNSSACPFAVRVSGEAYMESVGFFLSRHKFPEEGLIDTVNLTCSPETWQVKVDIQQLHDAYPNSVSQNIYMSNKFCPGFLDGDVLVFNSSYDDCNTKTTEDNTSIKFSNYLIEYETDPQTDIVVGARWRYNLECDLPKRETAAISFNPVNTNVATVGATDTLSGDGAVITFYSDDAFQNQMNGNPLKVNLGSRVYVQVAMKGSAQAKLFVDNCYVSEHIKGDNSTRAALIQDRCAANHFTHILGHVDSFTRFYFDVFDVPHHHDTIYVTCDVSFCPLVDFSPACQSGCNKTMS
ncbi:uncharacterized protein LOC124274191 [Haliotis rubra]|uniref:uncharacterized protein LOC124274191 n=1 Tax=Haliotis rubra TaxID=36100 RepID=UPI001EE5A218|nr:uncharacterized protein LOC124274191 [Haliotis rubra]